MSGFKFEGVYSFFKNGTKIVQENVNSAVEWGSRLHDMVAYQIDDFISDIKVEMYGAKSSLLAYESHDPNAEAAILLVPDPEQQLEEELEQEEIKDIEDLPAAEAGTDEGGHTTDFRIVEFNPGAVEGIDSLQRDLDFNNPDFELPEPYLVTLGNLKQPDVDPLVAVNDTGVTNEDTKLVVPAKGLLANDYATPAVPLIIKEVNGSTANVNANIVLASGATLHVNADGSYTYDPSGSATLNALSVGDVYLDSFTYKVIDGKGNFEVAKVTITVNGVNDPVSAVADTLTTNENTVLSVGAKGILTNDNDPDAHDILTVTKVNGLSTNVGQAISIGAGALLTVNSDGSYVVDPNGQYDFLPQGKSITVLANYEASDNHGSTSVAALNVVITGVNDAPVANNMNITATENGGKLLAIDFDADDADSDDDQNSLTYTIVSDLSAGEGIVINNKDSTFTYTPGNDFQELALGEKQTVDFTYKATDSHNVDSAIKTVSIEVTGINDAPVAKDMNLSATEDDGVALDPTDFDADDVDSDDEQLTLTYTITPGSLGAGEGSVTNNGDGTFTYSPGNDFQELYLGEKRTVDFTYQAKDSHGALSGIQTVKIEITGTNDAPTANDIFGIQATEDGGQVLPPTKFIADDIDNDNDQSNLLYSIVTPLAPDKGTVIINAGGTFTYDPLGNFQYLSAGKTEVVNFTYKATDIHGAVSDERTVSIVVTGVNDIFTAKTDSNTVDENSPLNVSAAFGVLSNDLDADNSDIHTVTLVNGAANVGTQITLASGALLTLNADGSYIYDTNGKFETLAVGKTDSDSFTYQATDGQGSFSMATVNITITGVNDAPVANDMSGIQATEDGGPIVPDTLFNAGDIDSDNDQTDLTYKIVTPLAANKGTVTINAGGTFTYDPGANFQYLSAGVTENISFTYTATDAHGAVSDVKTVTITVTGVNDIFTAVNDTKTVDENSSLNVLAVNGVLSNDLDADNGDTHTVTLVNGLASVGTQITLSSGALLTLNADGSYVYNTNGKFETLAVGQNASDSFTYQATDGHGSFSNATVNLTITGVNDAPIANKDTGSTNEETKLTVNSVSGVLANDTDIDSGAVLFVSKVEGSQSSVGNQITLKSGAFVIINADGSYSFDPNGKYNSLAVGSSTSETVAYTVSDGLGGTNNGQLVITINGVNDGPTAFNDSYSTTLSTKSGTSLSVNSSKGVLTNDTDPDLDGLVVSAVTGGTVGTAFTINNVTNTGSGLLKLDSTGAITFTTTNDILNRGTYTTTYTASDQHGGTSIATLTITVTPVVFDLNHDHQVSLISSADSHVSLNSFADSPVNIGDAKMGWVGPEDGILVYDFQHDGKVTDIREFAFSLYDQNAKTDLEGLRLAFDSNHDGVFDAKDSAFAEFGVWQDKNSNGVTDIGEYQSLTQAGVLSINLVSDQQMQIINGNTVYGSTSYQTSDGANHMAADVGLTVEATLTQQAPPTTSPVISSGDVVAPPPQLDFSAVTTEPATNQATANSEPVAAASAPAPTEAPALADAVQVAVSNEVQHITQQLTQQQHETPLS